MSDYVVDPLVATLALRPYEPATSLIARVAAMERADHAREFASDYYVNFQRVVSGDPRELEKVSHLLSADFTELSKWSPRQNGRIGFELGGELLTNYRSRRTRLRICPVCATEDVVAAPGLPLDAAIACRAFTLVDPIRTCFLHGIALVQVADSQSAGEHHHDHALAIAEALEDWNSLISNPVARQVTTFEWYLLGRLSFTPRIHVALADELDITDLTSIVQYLGVFILKGRTAVLADLDEDGLWQAADVGFRILKDGEDGVRRFVSDAYNHAVADDNEGMSNGIFDRFHYFLTAQHPLKRFQRIRQIIVDRLSELMPYGPDEGPIFGVRPTKRYWHTPQSAERQYRLPARTINKLVERAGIAIPLNRTKLDRRIRISAEALDRLMADRPLTRFFVATSTGAKRADFVAYEQAGLLAPAFETEGHKHRTTYRRSDVSRLEATLLRHATPQDGEVEDMVAIERAHLQTSWSLGEIARHIAEGRVRCSKVTGLKSLQSIRVSVQGLQSLDPLRNVPMTTVPEAAAIMRVGEVVITKLISTGRLSGYHRRNQESMRVNLVIPTAQMEEFHRRYISASEVWRSGIPLLHVTRKLREHGCDLAFPAEQLRCSFYDREEAERVLRFA